MHFSDLIIKLKDEDVPAHKFVLTARSNYWSNVADKAVLGILKNIIILKFCNLTKKIIFLDWSSFQNNLGSVLLKWIYTDDLPQDKFSIEMMKLAASFQLKELVAKCEIHLISTVILNDCVKFYIVAEETGADKLKDHCSSLISSHWVIIKLM